jgi:N-acetylglucosamine malate deacetylase 2
VTAAGRVTPPGTGSSRDLPRLKSVLAVCAHPDDESFGLGGVLSGLATAGTTCSVLCFTHGEASTLGAGTADLAHTRSAELTAAGAVLGAACTVLLGYPDGRLASIPVPGLAGHVRRLARQARAEALLVFDEGGITGHPDHRRATAAALSAAGCGGLTVIAWVIPGSVAHALNAEFGTTFTGRAPGKIDISVTVDRACQLQAIACHRSQSAANPVLWRRLELLGSTEHLRYLRKAPDEEGSMA